MKKIICLFLVCGTLFISAACSSQNNNEIASGTAAVTDTAAKETDSLPEADYEGYAYHVLTAAEQWQTYYNSEMTGDVVNDAVYKRNSNVEDRFNVKMDYIIFNGWSAGLESVKTALSAAVMAGSNEFDLFVGDNYYVGGRVFDNLLSDMSGCEYLDFSRDWWFKEIIDNHTLKNKIYLAAGYFGINTLRQTIVVYFNKTLIENYNIDNPYTIVNDGIWTFDKMTGMAKIAAEDINGNGKMDTDDQFGLVSTGIDAIAPLQAGLGYKYITMDADGNPGYTGLTDRLVTINELLYNLLHDKGYYYQTDVDNMLSVFASDKALFMVWCIYQSEIDIMRGMESYGFLPMPKLDEEQENYVSHGAFDAACIPSVVYDIELSSVILEALTYESYMNVVSAYYDVALTRKYTRDDDSVAMLDIIYKNTYTDFTQTFVDLTGNIFYKIGTSIDYVSWWDANNAKLTEKLTAALNELG